MEEEKKHRKRPEVEYVNGIPFRYNNPPYAVGNKYRSRLYVCNPETEQNELMLQLVEKSTPEKVLAEIKSLMQSFPDDHNEMILAWIHEGRLDPTFNNWYEWQKNYLVKELIWTRPIEDYDTAWKTVEETMGQVKFSQVRTEMRLTNEAKKQIESLFRRKTSIHAMEACERLVWKILSDLVERMIQLCLFESNPIRAIARKKSILPSTEKNRALNQRSFSARQMAEYIKNCLKIENEHLRAALLIRALLGLTVYELCGLDLCSYRPEIFPCFEVAKRYYQERGQAPIMEMELESLNCYRRVAFSQIADQFVKSFAKRRKKEGATGTDPLFLENGERLTPESVKRAEKELIAIVLASSELQRQRGDFIRSNAEYYMLNLAGMTNAEVDTMLGRDRGHTYAKSYVDWTNALVLSEIARKLDRWHSGLLQIQKDSKPVKRSIRVFEIKVSEGAKLLAKCGGEFYMTIDKKEC